LASARNTPVAIIDKLNHEINAVLSDREFKAQLADLGATVMVGSPAEFDKLIADETVKWGNVVKFAGAKPD
jgi:tripartite-type tricarboxylate transporter receptor subunit TctC